MVKKLVKVVAMPKKLLPKITWMILRKKQAEWSKD